MTTKVEKISKVAHEINRAYCLALGDTSQPAWEDAPEWQKQSVAAGVQYHIENPDTKPAHSDSLFSAVVRPLIGVIEGDPQPVCECDNG